MGTLQELCLTDVDANYPPIDKRDEAYKGHDLTIRRKGRHDPDADWQLAYALAQMMPWDHGYWGTGSGYPVPATVEAYFWATGLPGMVSR